MRLPSFLAFLAPSPAEQAYEVLIWNNCADYLDALTCDTAAEVAESCARDAAEYVRDYLSKDGPSERVHITPAGVAEVARRMLVACHHYAEKHAPHGSGFLPYRKGSAMLSGMRRLHVAGG